MLSRRGLHRLHLLGPADLLVEQRLNLPLRSDELAVDRFELGLLFIHLARVRGHGRAHRVVHLGPLLVQLAHFGSQRLDLGVLGDRVGCLARVLVMVVQGAELLNVVVILCKAGRLDDDSAAPIRCSGSGFGDRGAAGSARLGLAGLG